MLFSSRNRWILTPNNSLINMDSIGFIKTVDSADRYTIILKTILPGETELLYSSPDFSTRNAMFSSIIEAIKDKRLTVVDINNIVKEKIKYIL